MELVGLREIIDYEYPLGLRLYHNREYEDFEEHWHTGIEIIMPLSSTYTLIVGEERYCLQPGDIIIINSGVLHSIEAPPAGERIILQFDVVLLYSLKEMETLLALMPPVFLLTRSGRTELYDFVRERMDRIVKEYDEKETFREALIYAMLIEIYVELGRNAAIREIFNREGGAKGAGAKQREYLEVIMGVCSHINQHFQENLTLEEIAEISGFSKFHFTRVFKQYMNMTFYEYLNSRRIKRAEELLFSTEMNITEVAMNSGFSSLSAFNRTFKSLNKCSPTEFRNKVVFNQKEKPR